MHNPRFCESLLMFVDQENLKGMLVFHGMKEETTCVFASMYISIISLVVGIYGIHMLASGFVRYSKSCSNTYNTCRRNVRMVVV